MLPFDLAVRRLRRALVFLLVAGLLGTGSELLLLGHTEDIWQLVPLIIIILAIVGVSWHTYRPSPVSWWVVCVTMVLSAVSGIVGIVLHYRSNVEFERELDASLVGFTLVREAMMGATPSLAPGAMILLGCLGLIWIFIYREPLTPTS